MSNRQEVEIIMILDVFALPELVPVDAVYDLTVCIDVLRATSTITTALVQGAEKVVPFLTTEETLNARQKIQAISAEAATALILGGERQGVLIEGFDLGNSPRSYDHETVAGKTIFFTTTNGTKAILRGTGKVLLGSFLNLNALLRFIEKEKPERMAIICAGTCGQYTLEDMLLAGSIAAGLIHRLDGMEIIKNIQTETVLELWRKHFALHARWDGIDLFSISVNNADSSQTTDIFVAELIDFLRKSQGGKNLIRIGLDRDIADVAQINLYSQVASYAQGQIKLITLSE